MEQGNDFEKTSIFRRLANLLGNAPESAWENLVIVSFGAIVCAFLGEYLGIINFMIGIDGVLDDTSSLIGGCFFIIVGIVELYIIRKLPLKVMRKNVIIYACIISLAFATGMFCYWNIYFVIINVSFWIFLFIYLQLLDTDLSITGLFGFLVFILIADAAPTWGFVNYPIETIVLYAGFGFLMVIICSIPMFIIKILQKDPAKRELLSRLFKRDIQFHDFVKTKDAIIEFDNSKRSRSIISIAKDFYIARSNLQTLSKYMESDEDFELFTKEIDRLIGKVQVAILKGFDDGFEVNLGYITEYQKTLEYKLNNIHNKNSDLRLLDFTIRNYKLMFENLNAILNNEKHIDNIAPHKKQNNLLEIIKGFNLSNINLRYSIRSIISIILSYIIDSLIIVNTFNLTTLISAFTIKPSASNTNRDILIRFISTIVGIFLGIIISFVLTHFELYVVLGICDIIAFILFFVFIEDEQLSLIFVMMGFIFLNYSESLAVSIEHFILTILSMFIIIIISNFVLPSNENSNIIKLFKTKLDLIIKFNTTTLIKNEDNADVNIELSNNNYEIMKLFSNFNDTYSNVSKDVRILSELNSTFEDYINTILSIKMFSKDYDFSEFGDIMNLVFNNIKYPFNGEEVPKDGNINLKDFINKISQDDKMKFLVPSFANIARDIIYMRDLIMEAENDNIFEIYNQDILEENIRDKINIKNLKYLLNQYRYIFVAANYIYNMSPSDFKNLAKEKGENIHKFYDKSVVQGYNIVQDEIKTIYKTSHENYDEVKYFINFEKKFKDNFDKLNEISDDVQDQIYDIYNVSYMNMDNIQKMNKGNINKIYTSKGVIEIPDETVKELYSFSKDNVKFTHNFLKATLYKNVKTFYQSDFKTEFDKEKSLKDKRK